MGTKQLEIEQNQNIYTPECRPGLKKKFKKLKKTLAFYGYDIIIVYDKEKNTYRKNKRRKEKKSLDSILDLLDIIINNKGEKHYVLKLNHTILNLLTNKLVIY